VSLNSFYQQVRRAYYIFRPSLGEINSVSPEIFPREEYTETFLKNEAQNFQPLNPRRGGPQNIKPLEIGKKVAQGPAPFP